MTRKLNSVNDPSNGSYHVGNDIIYNTEVLKCNLWDYNGAYIVVRSDIAVIAGAAIQFTFKNWLISIDDAEYFNMVIPMYDLLKYSSDYWVTIGSLWFYSKDQIVATSHLDLI